MIARIADFVSLYWRVAIGPLGAVFLAVATLDAMQNEHPRLEGLLLFIGAALTFYGGITASAFTNSNKKLSDKLADLQNDLARRRQRQIFLILAASKEDFQVDLNHHLLRTIREREFVVQVFCPSEDFSSNSMFRSQEFIIENRDQYFGGLVIASQFADDNLRALRTFASDVKLPVIFIDHVPPQADSTFPSNASWVTVRDSSGGQKAVEAVVALGIEPKRILVVAGPAKKDRQEFFRQGIEERWPSCAVRITTDGGFNRHTAEEVLGNILAEATAQKAVYDVIFCTTDSMTLGCLDALQSFDWKDETRPTVIGYDGIEATRRLILHRQTQLKRVVVQDAARLAEASVQELENFRRSGQGNGVIWVEPALFPD